MDVTMLYTQRHGRKQTNTRMLQTVSESLYKMSNIIEIE
ncbi:hypothetical protein I7I48_10150 [Histoplasma ohiense]|nr:hypothetical protein I7I48_10150 [Histoplasma ohiense (nom. inval.)]